MIPICKISVLYWRSFTITASHSKHSCENYDVSDGNDQTRCFLWRVSQWGSVIITIRVITVSDKLIPLVTTQMRVAFRFDRAR